MTIWFHRFHIRKLNEWGPKPGRWISILRSYFYLQKMNFPIAFFNCKIRKIFYQINETFFYPFFFACIHFTAFAFQSKINLRDRSYWIGLLFKLFWMNPPFVCMPKERTRLKIDILLECLLINWIYIYIYASSSSNK